VTSALEVAVDDPLEGFFEGEKPLLVALADHPESASPARPLSDPRLRERSSARRQPVRRSVAMNARSRSGHGPRARRRRIWEAPLAAA
jgi:hypothetical protein